MNISITAEQKKFIQFKITTGKYQSTEEVLEIALQLLDEYDRAETEWSQEVKAKIEEAIAVSEKTPPLDGETFVNEIIDRFTKEKAHQG